VRDGQAFAFECEQFILDDETLDRIPFSTNSTSWRRTTSCSSASTSTRPLAAPTRCSTSPFIAGNREDAARRLAAGGACVVPAMFALQSRFGVGDRITLRVPVPATNGAPGEVAGERTVSLEIVGVVDVNWHLISARAGLRGLDGKPFSTISPVFVSCAQSRAITVRDEKVRFLWVNFTDDLRALQTEDAVTEFQNRITRALVPAGGPPGGGRMGMGMGGPPPQAMGGSPAALTGEPRRRPRRRTGRNAPARPRRVRTRRKAGAFVQVSHRDFVFSARHATRTTSSAPCRASRCGHWRSSPSASSMPSSPRSRPGGWKSGACARSACPARNCCGSSASKAF
jgi:hypothetical protein